MAERSRTRARPAAFVPRVLVALPLACTLLVLAPAPAGAEGRVPFLAERLKYPPSAGQPDDFRVRTNAALALGATNDDDAVPALCGGLGDPSEIVRQAVAVALRRLARASSLDCLHKRYPAEANAAVKLQIQRAIEVVEAADSSGGGGASSSSGGGGTAAPYVAGAKYYVAISPIANRTSRPGAEVERIVHDAVGSKLGQLGDYQMAPPGESSEAAKAAIGKRHLKGYYLAVSVEKFDYSDGNLRVRVKIAVFSYPGKDLRGEVPAGATLQGTRPGDKGAEDQLMSVAAASAAELFAQNFK